MKLCRFEATGSTPAAPGEPKARIGVFSPDHSQVIDLGPLGVRDLASLLNRSDLLDFLGRAQSSDKGLRLPASAITLLPPVDTQEVWAAGVTYLRSKSARMEESDFSATAYDRVYDAPRPEIFFKSMPAKVSGPNGPIGIRADARWNVPEPELVLVLNDRGTVVGYTIGNDMSSRDIEGENLLYLPQAKMYKHACALGPCITVGVSEEEARGWTISVAIERAGAAVFSGSTEVSKIKRSFNELSEWLFRSQEFPTGAMLLTGTGVVPPNEFTLAAGDVVRIRISGIGELVNTVQVV
jgi:2-dehydro-3-deoxy-D-arabinonate dehydratase